MNKVLQEGKGRKIEVDYKNRLVYKTGSYLKLLKEWNNLKKLYTLNINVPKPVKFDRKSLLKAQIVMSFILGKTLEELLPKLNYQEKLKIAYELGKIFKDFNKHNIWHEDIHAGNIIITSEKKIFLVDLYKIKKASNLKTLQINQLSVLYGAFIKEINNKIILSFLKGYLGNYKEAKEFIIKYGKEIKKKGIKNLVSILKNEISHLNNPRRFKEVSLENWKGYLALRTNNFIYEDQILTWLNTYQKENKILGDIIKNGRSALVVRYKDVCLKLFKKRKHKWRGLKDLILYNLNYTRARRSFINAYLFYFLCGDTPPPLGFFENKNGESLFVSVFVKNSKNFLKFIENLSPKEKEFYINMLLNWFKKILDFNFISKDAAFKNILIDSENNFWLVDTFDIIYTSNSDKKEKSFNRLLKDVRKFGIFYEK